MTVPSLAPRPCLVRAALLATLSASDSRAFSPGPTVRTFAAGAAAEASAASAVRMSSSASPKRDVPYGAWTSPITSKAITAGSVSLGSLRVSPSSSSSSSSSSGGSCRLYWLEGRPRGGGRYVLCRHRPDDPSRSERNAVDVTPPGSNARTRVHEYGGGSVTFGGGGGGDDGDDDDGEGEEIYYSEFATQRLMKMREERGEGGAAAAAVAVPLTPDGGRFRFADGRVLPGGGGGGKKLVMVREDHADPAPKDVVNEIVSVDAGDGSMTVLATGNDFYAAPRPSPDGTKLAYVTWNHPNMPWDATELRVVDLRDGAPSGSDEHDLIAGSDGDTSVMQPMWHPATGELYYISDETGYYNIYRAGSGDGSEPVNVLPMEHDFGGASPGWMLGQQGFAFLDDGRLVATYNKDGRTRLVVADVGGEGAARDVAEYGSSDGLPTQFGGVVPAPGGEALFFIGGSPSAPTSVYRWDLSAPGEPAEVLACSSTLQFPSDVISVPEQIEFPTVLGTAYGYYYPPANGAYECTTEDAPPLLVKAHGGPTSCAGASFNPSIQYWTSRGFAVLDVDYGGSTGYGREYRRRLRGSWGVTDVDDVCAGARYLAERGLADGGRLCIDGGSAGGYTTLSALAFRDAFTAGCSLYGIGDLTALAGDTHKFESRYLDGLVGPYPAEEALYRERSPIESVDTLSCPILLLQGEEDKVVPPNQAEMMHAALKGKGLPTCLKIYKGEQHGFRKAENIEDALDSELAFFGRVYGIDVPGAVELDIDNM